MSRRPSGFVAVCQCGQTVGSMDFNRTPSNEVGKILGGWLYSGCTVSPRFGYEWEVRVEKCKCGESKEAAHA